MNIQIINSPSKGTTEILIQRIRNEKIQKDLREGKFNSIGLVQGQLADIITASDVAAKASNVQVCEIMGICPQHVTLIGIFGDNSSIETAIRVIKSKFNVK